MIIVTGGAGFIGSNLIKALNNQGYHDILVVDDLEDGTKYTNLVDLSIIDYLDKQTFIQKIDNNEEFGKIDGVFHEGACSATTEWNGQFMMENNYEYSKKLLHYCLNRSVPFLYASSAAVYGAKNHNFIENQLNEKPLNVYGYSKYLFDCYVMRLLPKINSPVCGFRYFNVYGPREQHKGSMSSVAYHLNSQLQQGNTIQLFEGSEEFKRDFIYVADAVDMNIWFWLNRKSGIFNCGTGKAESFKRIAEAVLHFHQRGQLEYIPFPEHLKGRYQSFTQADMSLVRAAGYQKAFHSVTEGTLDYMQQINA